MAPGGGTPDRRGHGHRRRRYLHRHRRGRIVRDHAEDGRRADPDGDLCRRRELEQQHLGRTAAHRPAAEQPRRTAARRQSAEHHGRTAADRQSTERAAAGCQSTEPAAGSYFRRKADQPEVPHLRQEAVRSDRPPARPGRHHLHLHAGRCCNRALRIHPAGTRPCGQRQVGRGEQAQPGQAQVRYGQRPADVRRHAGLNTVRFAGWLSRTKKLTPGSHTLRIAAITPGVGVTAQQLQFRVVR